MLLAHGKTYRKSRLERVGQRNGPYVTDRVFVEVKLCDGAIGLVRCWACHAQIIQNDGTAMSREFYAQRSP